MQVFNQGIKVKATGILVLVLWQTISVDDAVDMATGHINVQPHQGVEDEEEEEDEEANEVEEEIRQLMPP